MAHSILSSSKNLDLDGIQNPRHWRDYVLGQKNTPLHYYLEVFHVIVDAVFYEIQKKVPTFVLQLKGEKIVAQESR